MELILTSFGLSHLRDQEDNESNIFYRMPPIALSKVNSLFLPDYAILLLCDRLIVDAETYDRLVNSNKRHASYEDVAALMKVLNDEGFLRLEDFNTVVTENQPLLEDMLEHDLKKVSLWVPALTESAAAWSDFIDGISRPLRDSLFQTQRKYRFTNGDAESFGRHYVSHTSDKPSMYVHILNNYGHHSRMIGESARVLFKDKRRKEYKEYLRRQLAEYLSYVNVNLLLAQTYDVGFHDWYDFRPFYRAKFRLIGREKTPAEPQIDNVKKLFEISFPNLSFWEPHLVVKALKDKRIHDLRKLVAEAASGDVQFDTEFATRILYEVFRVEQGLSHFRSIVSYASIGLGFIPWVGTPAQKLVEEAIVTPVARKRRSPFRWFYMISELAESSRRGE